MSKIYAVKKGYSTGIRYSWEECKRDTQGYSGAEYKSFKTEEEADAYLRGESLGVSTNLGKKIKVERPLDDSVNIYTDGSYKDGIVSFGCFIQTKNKDFKFYGTVNYNTTLANIAGELLGVLVGVQLVNNLGFKNIHILYDYEGIEKWYNMEWRAKGDLQSKYVNIMNNLRLLHNLSYDFIKVAGHSTVEGNIIADKLASKARLVGNCDVRINEILAGNINCSKVCLCKVF